jgi:hypothetical protein
MSILSILINGVSLLQIPSLGIDNEWRAREIRRESRC